MPLVSPQQVVTLGYQRDTRPSMGVENDMKTFTGFVVAFLLIFAATGCATPKATYEQGLFAGQAESRTLSLVDRMESRGKHWQDRALAHERAEAIRIAAEQRSLARQFRDPSLVEHYTWQAATDYFNHQAHIDAIEQAENAAWAADREVARVLAAAPIDVSNMSALQDQARDRFARETTTGLLRIGADAWATHQAEEARRQVERTRRDIERREADLDRQLAEMEHHEPPPTPSAEGAN